MKLLPREIGSCIECPFYRAPILTPVPGNTGVIIAQNGFCNILTARCGGYPAEIYSPYSIFANCPLEEAP